MRSNILLTPPSVEPVTLSEVKAHARIESSADDELLTSLLKSARQWCEAYLRRALISQSWALHLSGVPRSDRIVIPRGPLLSVTKIQIFDDHDVATDWGSENYFVNTASQPGEIVLRSGSTWMSPTRCSNGIVIEYIAGYGATAENVPQDIRLAIKQLVLHWYEHRGEASTSSTYARAPLTIEALLQAHKFLHMGMPCA